MLHVQDSSVRKLLLKGTFGLEKESLRVLTDGTFAHSVHPFPEDEQIVRDFCENQTEVNTDVYESAQAAVDALAKVTARIQQRLMTLTPRELLWPFSNPPYIRNEQDIPIAQFYGDQSSKTAYREYLSDRYGRYKMTFSGIHINYSFDDELLKADFACSRFAGFQEYKNDLYVALAENAAAYGWIMTAVTAASPVLDSSFIETGVTGKTVFNGMASTRCSELGYWNFFAPVFDYSNVQTYADSIQKYVDDQLLAAPSELYYPIRLKPAGPNHLPALKNRGVNHIELRMVDLNPLEYAGLNVKDLEFSRLLLTWLACQPRMNMNEAEQIQSVQNFKNAAHYDLKTVKILMPGGSALSVQAAALQMIGSMQSFYKDFPEEIQEVLDFEKRKFTDPACRYAWKIREMFGGDFVGKGTAFAKQLQREMHDR